MTVLSIKSVWKRGINIIFQMLIWKSVTHFIEINKCSSTSWISSNYYSKISWIVRWPWLNHVCVCLCVSVSLCLSNWFYKLIHGPQKQILVFLSGNLDFGLEKPWKNRGAFFWDFCGNPVKCNTSYSTDKPNFLEFWIKIARMTLKVKVNHPIFNISKKCPRIHVWCKFGDSSSNPLQIVTLTSWISKNSESKWPK